MNVIIDCRAWSLNKVKITCKCSSYFLLPHRRKNYPFCVFCPSFILNLILIMTLLNPSKYYFTNLYFIVTLIRIHRKIKKMYSKNQNFIKKKIDTSVQVCLKTLLLRWFFIIIILTMVIASNFIIKLGYLFFNSHFYFCVMVFLFFKMLIQILILITLIKIYQVSQLIMGIKTRFF